jgi:hypothetical protein
MGGRKPVGGGLKPPNKSKAVKRAPDRFFILEKGIRVVPPLNPYRKIVRKAYLAIK